ncbi:uncharacterized protein LOC106469993 [Limulus polyphemus]|uniref:Uncharacterized protein LOC106469993 n=1 Tax=Limulus polyphemus TaxID=6850 RepID=A0ABM1BP65_LIMPO|nr:uncharacterized protein LOC106469993 [Limulus polyphemus]XP_022254258.1 uncharacterized protein LOC106469993 [Limulus polyphemus]XP_022254259.1 uncharacterized protein LOC106469993 [Limulus polyphemus]
MSLYVPYAINQRLHGKNAEIDKILNEITNELEEENRLLMSFYKDALMKIGNVKYEDVPHSVFKQIAETVEARSDDDWKDIASKLGVGNVGELKIIEKRSRNLNELPLYTLFVSNLSKGSGTLGQILKILLDIERYDILRKIQGEIITLQAKHSNSQSLERSDSINWNHSQFPVEDDSSYFSSSLSNRQQTSTDNLCCEVNDTTRESDLFSCTNSSIYSASHSFEGNNLEITESRNDCCSNAREKDLLLGTNCCVTVKPEEKEFENNFSSKCNRKSYKNFKRNIQSTPVFHANEEKRYREESIDIESSGSSYEISNLSCESNGSIFQPESISSCRSEDADINDLYTYAPYQGNSFTSRGPILMSQDVAVTLYNFWDNEGSVSGQLKRIPRIACGKADSQVYIGPERICETLYRPLSNKFASVFITHTLDDIEVAMKLKDKMNFQFNVTFARELDVELAFDPYSNIRKLLENVDFIVPIVSPSYLQEIEPVDIQTRSTDSLHVRYIFQHYQNEYANKACLNYKIRPVMVSGMKQADLGNRLELRCCLRLWEEVPRLCNILKMTKEKYPHMYLRQKND